MIWSLAYFPALAGLAIWALGSSRGRDATLALGATAVTLALAVDAGIGPVQERCFRGFTCSKAQLLAWAYSGAAAINLLLAIGSGGE